MNHDTTRRDWRYPDPDVLVHQQRYRATERRLNIAMSVLAFLAACVVTWLAAAVL